jgi:hypothetical protein
VRPRHDLIPLAERDRWRHALAGIPHGHAHTWGFCRAIQLTSELPTYLYRYRAGDCDVACPLIEREFLGRVDVATPYGFGGFATAGGCEGFAREWRAFARSRRWVCGYVALNPLLFDPGAVPRAEVHVHNHLYVMDLRGTDADLRARLSANRRRQLRDWPSVAGTIEEDRPRLTSFLVDAYADFFARRGAGPATDFTPETMEAIAALDDVLIVGARGSKGVEAVAVVGHTPHCADYLFGISIPGGERHAAHLVWWLVERLRHLGVPWLNLGGGIGEDDGVAEFKRRFGATRRPLASLRQIYETDTYEELCRSRGVSATVRTGYFPPYRVA